MGNSRVKESFELALDARQVIAVLLASLVILGAVFVLGVSVGRQSRTAEPAQPLVAPRDPLARLDEPLPTREESPPELKAHQALTDPRAIEKTLPAPAVRPTAVAVAPHPPAATPAASRSAPCSGERTPSGSPGSTPPAARAS
jgi:hypothetical protein